MVDEICRKLTRRQKQKPSQGPDCTSKDKDKDYLRKYNFSYQLKLYTIGKQLVVVYKTTKI